MPFPPTRSAWLPVLHTQRGRTHYTALFSNTAHAHELGAIQDWVVIYRDDAHGAGQRTLVTAHYGHLKGKRIVRGREAECEDMTLFVQLPPEPLPSAQPCQCHAVAKHSHVVVIAFHADTQAVLCWS